MNNFNNKGSTMVMLVIIITILTMLGMVIISLSVSSYKINKVDSSSKKALYISDGGIQAIYCNIYELVAKAVDEAEDEADNLVKDNKETNTEYEYKQNQKFKSTYVSFINNNKGQYINKSPSLLKKPELIIKINSSKTDSSNSSYIYINRQAEYKVDKIQKIISAIYKITIPNYEDKYIIEELIEITDWKIEK